MQKATIIHNPTSGDAVYSKKEIIRLAEAAGYSCRYVSTKEEGWKDIDGETDVLIVAGGDGTVRKVATLMLNRKLKDKTIPVLLLPAGTANNIAKTLDLLNRQPEELIKPAGSAHVRCFDIGRINNIPDHEFFMESFGYGIFPYLMKQMKKVEKEELPDSTGEELAMALQTLYDVCEAYEPKQCSLTVDGTDHSGKFLMAEVMNIKSIGPNLELAPLADPGDGEFEIVLVPESHKSKFMCFIADLQQGRETNYQFHTLKGSNVSISWNGTHVHVDDKVVKISDNTTVSVEVKRGVLEFLLPNP